MRMHHASSPNETFSILALRASASHSTALMHYRGTGQSLLGFDETSIGKQGNALLILPVVSSLFQL